MKRVLMITIVPPFPDDQGNRVVTKSYMDFFLSLGYDIDVVIQCGYDEDRVKDYFGDRVVMYRSSPPDIVEDSSISEWRESIRTQSFKLYDSADDPYQKDILKEIFCAANHKHPFSRISNESIVLSERLLRDNRYEYIVCNYTCTLSVVRELKKKKYTLPQSIAITHDALSRLDFESYEYGISTYGLACSKDTERDCLKEADIICAISEYEKKYFLSMNPDWKVVLVEYPSWSSSKNTVSEENFDYKRIVFFASGNQPNEKGINDFLKYSWPDIKRKLATVQLYIIGTICKKITSEDDAVITLGRVDEQELWKYITASTIGINPVYMGTGLKIKSVDMMCAGLPFVSFDTGIEGMEDLDGTAFITVKDWKHFSDETVALLSNYDKWNYMRKNGGDKSRQRFSPNNTYKELYENMHWA